MYLGGTTHRYLATAFSPVESLSLVLVINDTKLLIPCV